LLVGLALAGGTRAGGAAEILQTCGEPVAAALERGEVEQAGSGGVADRSTGQRRDVGEAVGDERRELTLQTRDLRPQRAPRGSLGDLRERQGDRLAGVPGDHAHTTVHLLLALPQRKHLLTGGQDADSTSAPCGDRRLRAPVVAPVTPPAGAHRRSVTEVAGRTPIGTTSSPAERRG
jgi:hypothetical protein